FTNIDDTDVKFESYSKLLDYYFKTKFEKEIINSRTNHLSSFVNKQLAKLETKLVKLNEDLINSDKKDIFKLNGELLLSYYNLKEKKESIEILNYYNNEIITIKLDPKITVLENSKLYYKKYTKYKNSIYHINQQITETNTELEYFNQIKDQLIYSSLSDILEIKDELEKNRYLVKSNSNKKDKLKKVQCTTFIIDKDTQILVGKNNIQNDIVTNKLAKPNDLWFHVKDGGGSHVLIKSNKTINDELIFIAANLASYYSIHKDSSSVAVNYTLAKFIKKIPSKKGCFVSITNFKTIFIDPNYNDILKLETL
ncbi:MAG: NFACT RNA binding domain-containing protein, partial [Anaeroplasmataceae bacterium]